MWKRIAGAVKASAVAPAAPVRRLSHLRPAPGHRYTLSAGWAEGIEPLDHDIQEGVAVRLNVKAAGDEGRRDVRAIRRLVTNQVRQRARSVPPLLHPMIWKESSRHRQSKLMFGAGCPLALQVDTVT